MPVPVDGVPFPGSGSDRSSWRRDASSAFMPPRLVAATSPSLPRRPRTAPSHRHQTSLRLRAATLSTDHLPQSPPPPLLFLPFGLAAGAIEPASAHTHRVRQ
eukprot:TRINITY_DN16474_c0_g1_i3.p2 TRINITY_DN16474_c0_g1~~TRINITY_DN16474_c0_g1_i3.p2  ORF type:complete len:102 (-),score=8.67 TRINITY_DN16474_c0_g1_i3:16-321(-)